MLEKIHRLFMSYEKEENWLNKMSWMGMMLRETSWGTYYFEKGMPGEYTYRIELLPELPNHPESKAYIDFLEETGVECVSTYFRWVYFRKKASEGPFDLYSDIDSKILHYNRILLIYGIPWILNFISVIVNACTMVFSVINHHAYQNRINLQIAIISAVITICFSVICFSYIKKINRLKKQKRLNE